MVRALHGTIIDLFQSVSFVLLYSRPHLLFLCLHLKGPPGIEGIDGKDGKPGLRVNKLSYTTADNPCIIIVLF